MALTPTEARAVARELARRVFVQPNATATLDLDDLQGIVERIDGAMDTDIDTIAAARDGTLKAVLAEHAKGSTGATNTQLAFALALWAMREVGII